MKKYVAAAAIGLFALAALGALSQRSAVASSVRSRAMLTAADQEAMLNDKLRRLVERRFDGDWARAFAHYASVDRQTDAVTRDELVVALDDAGVGSFLTRGALADRVLDRADRSRDGAISWEELDEVVRHHHR